MDEISWLDFAGVGYDFDGTLANSQAAHTESRLEAFMAYAEQHGDERFVNIPPALHDEAHKHGHHSIEIIGWVLHQSGITPEVESGDAEAIRLLKNELFWQKSQSGLPAMPGALEFVRTGHDFWLGNQGIVTSGYRDREVMPFVSANGLEAVFPAQNIITADDFLLPDGEIDRDRQKPKPDQYDLLVERLAIKPADLLVFEDNRRGIQAAKAAGAFVIGVANMLSTDEIKQFPDEAQPDLIVENFDHARQLLRV
jgi:beta-phosphoglucomutase-like phosphatase (HAD superfamily)